MASSPATDDGGRRVSLFPLCGYNVMLYGHLMNTTTTPTAVAGFRYIGVTDDATTCDKCGREELRSTIVLELLDAEGNGTGDVVRYGSTCAARALAERTGRRHAGAAVRAAAMSARFRTLAMAQDAAERLSFYGIPVAGDVPDGAMGAYLAANSVAVDNHGRELVAERFAESVVAWRAAMSDAAKLSA